MGNITGGPSSINLYDLADVSIVSPLAGQYLRYNSAISEWQNAYINTDVYDFLDANMSGSNGVAITYTPGPNTVGIALSLSATGDATGSVSAGSLPLTLATVNSNVGSFGSATQVPVFTVNAKGLVTGVTNTTISGLPNSALTNNSITVGSTNIALGATETTISGLASVTATTFTGTLSGNATTSTTLATGRTFSVSGDATGTSAAFNGSANASIPLTLATVGTAVSDQFRKITVNAKGLTTATSAVVPADITTALGFTPVNRAGDTMTGQLVLSGNPASAFDAATKQYVDNTAEGIKAKPSAEVATTANLTSTYNNGASGVGATLTATTNGAFPTIDGVTVATTTPGLNGVLVKDQTNAAQNGRYNLTQIGDGSTPWILTRCTICDTAANIPGSYVFIKGGTQAGTGWVAIVANPSTFVVGTDAILWTQFSGAGTYVGGTGINVGGTVISNTGVLSLTTNTGLSTNTSATGNVTVTNTGVVSLSGSTNVSVSGSTGAVTLSLPTTLSGLSSVTSTSFVGALTGNAATVTNGVYTTGDQTIGGNKSFTNVLATTSNRMTVINATTPMYEMHIPSVIASAWYVQAGSTRLATTNGSGSISTVLTTIDTSGNLTATGDLTAFSDARIKTDIQVVPDALNKVLQLRGVTYLRTDNSDLEKGKRSIGVIAQEVLPIIPEAVMLDSVDPENGTMSVKYGNMVGLLIEAIKELKTEVDALKAEITALKG
jgi:hypothetical protein